MIELNAWTKRLREIYDGTLEKYRGGTQSLDDAYFDAEEVRFLSSIGLRPINVFDFVEDFADSGEPDWDTFLLIVAARRDYFLYEQGGTQSVKEIDAKDLPPKRAELGGVRWLPRIIRKAECFLEGGLCHDIMYCCGGDRHFLTEHEVHPADFLREVWAAKGDGKKVLAFVRKNGV